MRMLATQRRQRPGVIVSSLSSAAAAPPIGTQAQSQHHLCPQYVTLLLLPALSVCRHYKLWEDLRLDYEIERRFDAINRKLGPMLENAKFLLDVRAEQKSSGAEWIIIGLICLEVLMNGFGHLAAYFW